MEYQKMTKFFKHLQQNNSEKVKNENDKEICKERYIYLQKKQKIIDNLRPIIIV